MTQARVPRRVALALLSALAVLDAASTPAQTPAPVPPPTTIPRFVRPPNPIALVGPARPGQYMEASGRRAAFLGREDGSFEAWVYPLKVLRDFRLSFGTAAYATPIPGAALAATVDVRPEASTVRYSHAAFTVDATWFVPLDEHGGVVLLDVHTSEPLTVVVQFRVELKPMWPAALGGQYSYWDRTLQAYVAGEASRKHAALVGAPLALTPPEQPAHNLPDAPSQFSIAITPDAAARGLVPIVIAASTDGLEAAKATYHRLLTQTAARYADTFAHYRRLRDELTSLDTPDARVNLALEWGKVALDKGFVCNPHLGCGLIAGLGPSGTSERPGFGWFFGGDAFINSWAMTAYGDFETVKRTLEFLRRRQRDDGKMMHELSQGAHYLRWFEDFPYGYYHADTTPLYIIAVRDYVRASGDVALAKDFWPSIRKAYDYCLSTDEDGDGLMDNTKAGLAAVETGALRSRDVLTDVFLGAAWTEAAAATSELAALSGEVFASTADLVASAARTALNRRFLDDWQRRIFFAVMKDGKGQAEHTVWPAFGLWRGVFDTGRPAVEGMLDELAGAGLGADWGARMLSNESALYEPLSYNNGASWPFLTGFAALALYANGRPDAAWGYLDGMADLTFLESRGYMAELFSGDRLRSIDAAVPHQLFATTGFVSTLLRGLVGIRAAAAERRDGKVLPERLVVAPQLPAGWGWLRIRNLRWRNAAIDLAITRDERSYSVSIHPRAGTLPLEFQASFPPAALVDRDSRGRPTSAATVWQRLPDPMRAGPPVLQGPTAARRPGSPGDGGAQDRGQRFWRFDTVAGPVQFVLPVSPGIEVVPLNAPLALGDESTRLRVIDAWMGATAYTLVVEGRRGRAYSLRLRVPFPIASIDGAMANTPDGKPLRVPVQELVIRFPPADPADPAAGAPGAPPERAQSARRRDWAVQVVSIRFGR